MTIKTKAPAKPKGKKAVVLRGDAKKTPVKLRGDAKKQPKAVVADGSGVYSNRIRALTKLSVSSKGGGGKATRVVPKVRRAAVLEQDQFAEVIRAIEDYDLTNAVRNEVIMRLSFQAGLRAKEIAGLRWLPNVLDAKGKVAKMLTVTHDIGKRSQERQIPLAPELRKALQYLLDEGHNSEHVIYRLNPYDGIDGISPNGVVQTVKRFFKYVGYVGCTSHSGRRTFITNAARRANLHGSSIKDVQEMAGHKYLQSTTKYIEPSDQQHNLVNSLYR